MSQAYHDKFIKLLPVLPKPSEFTLHYSKPDDDLY